MASVQRTINTAMGHLKDLTVSQRLAIALGVILVVGSLAWMIQWAASPEMVPLFPQTLASDDLASVSEGLDTLGVPYKIVGSQVMVRAADDRSSLLARLQQANKMPSDTSLTFDQLVKESNPWISQDENNRRWSLAMQNEVERVLANFSGVRSADVFLNLSAQKRTFARHAPENTASVTLSMSGGVPVPRTLAISAARLVSGAVRGLPLRNVQVVDSLGRAAIDWEDEEDGSLSALMRRRREQERDTAAKIARQLSYVPDLRVSVQVVLDPTSTKTDATTITEGALLSKRQFDDQTQGMQQGGQPGVQPNVGVQAGGAVAVGESQTRSETEQEYQPGQEHKSTIQPAGRLEKTYAAVSISYSYLESVFKRVKPDADPTDADIEQVFAKEKERFERQVGKLVYPPSREQVAVDWHYDALAPQAVASFDGVDLSFDLLGEYGPVSALGALALVSLFMMARMARSTSSGESFGVEIGMPKEAIEAAKRAAEDLKSAPPPAFDETRVAVHVPIGQEADGILEGQEVDPQTAQIDKMIEQVAKMIQADDEGVPALVEKWIQED